MLWLLVGLAVVAALIVWSFHSSKRSPYRYRMTVEIETPQGLRVGQSVREVSYYSRPQGVYGAKVRGEAAAIDLPDGPTLFALLFDANGMSDYGARIADWALKGDVSPGGANAGYVPGQFAELYPTKPRTRSPIGSTSGPMLVRFRDVADPSSVERVDPNDLSATFGAGVRLRRITIEMTQDAVTEGIRRRLPWVSQHSGSLEYTGSPHPAEPEKDLTRSAFIQGGK
jgi:hypothetical protein